MKTGALPKLFGKTVTELHCVGVGGMGLGPLAIYLAGRGFIVSGEDDAMSAAMRDQLATAGVVVTAAGAVPADVQLVVCSSAIASSHPAALAAKARGLPLVRRGELLAEATRDRRLVALCGSHGKTSTTAMLVTALRAAGFPAGYVLGGLFNDDAVPPADPGANDWVVAEIDESDGTIGSFSPEITVVVNLDWDHPDHYRKQADLEDTFAALFARTRQMVLINEACGLSARVAANTTSRVNFGRTGDYRAETIGDREGIIELALGGRFSASRAKVRAMGEFNASNATAAFAAALLMGVGASFANLLAAYPGVRRRQAVLRATKELTVIEDYAHHPAEIRALMGSLRKRTAGRLVVVFQPHRFSRTAQFKTEFAAALALGDVVYLLDVYGAGEAALAGGTTAGVHAELRRIAPALPVFYHPADTDGLLRTLAQEIRPGDFVAFVGAGDIDVMAREWLKLASSARDWDRAAETLLGAVSAGTKLKREESLAKKTTIGIGGTARIYAEPAGVEDLQALVRAAKRLELPVIMLGRGSNLLVPDEGVDALVVSLRLPAWESFEARADGSVWVGAGLRLKNLCGLAAKAGLVGFEFMEGIPGNIGGALRMNAGAMNGWIFDVVEEVHVMTFDGEIRIFKKSEMHVEYRHCAELNEAIALGALLRPAAQAGAGEIARQIDAYKEKRMKSQPREPSAGCIFKNPPGDFAGRLIDASGLKGERVGDAEVSATHANFIVNQGCASAADVIALVRRVRARVNQAQGVQLEPEVLLYGKNWKDFL